MDEMVKVQRYWNDIARNFDAIYSGQKSTMGKVLDRLLRRDMFQRFEWVMRKTGDVAGQSICDVGCGSGRFIATLAQRGAAKVVGIDVAPEMLKLASQLAEAQNVARSCRFHLMDVVDWNSDEQFDITIAIGFWDYIADPTARLSVIRKMTRGTFLSAWPRFGTWRMPIRKARLRLQGCPVYFYRESEIYQLLGKAGFSVKSSERLGQLFCVEAIPIETQLRISDL